MRHTIRQTRENRTITIDFHDEATYFQLLGNGKAFVECVLAFLLALGFQVAHKATCRGGGCLTRHSHYARVRLGGLTLWRVQCTRCKAVFTVLPHFVLRYRQMRPEVARDALLATHGGLSLELCAVLYHISPMALYRLVCALGQHSVVRVLTRCGLPRPVYFLADEKHSPLSHRQSVSADHCLWTRHLASGLRGGCQCGGVYPVISGVPTGGYRRALLSGPGILIDGFDSTTSSMRTLFPGARLGNCLRHALNKLPKKLTAIASPMRRRYAPSSTRCSTGCASGRAYGCLPWASGYATLRTMSPPRQERPTATGCASGCRTRSGLVCRPCRRADARDQYAARSGA